MFCRTRVQLLHFMFFFSHLYLFFSLISVFISIVFSFLYFVYVLPLNLAFVTIIITVIISIFDFLIFLLFYFFSSSSSCSSSMVGRISLIYFYCCLLSFPAYSICMYLFIYFRSSFFLSPAGQDNLYRKNDVIDYCQYCYYQQYTRTHADGHTTTFFKK